MAEEKALVLSDEFKERVRAFKKDFYQKYKKISKEKTPQVDGSGKKIIDRRPDGMDFVIEAYMRDCLDKHFPGWSWEAAAPMLAIANAWLLAQGHLIVLDEYLVAYGITPPVRKFYAVGAARIQIKRGTINPGPESIVDLDKNAKAANSNALKKAINQLTHIGDDVYGKRIEEEGAGTLEEVLATTLDSSTAVTAFNELVKKKHLAWSKVFEILGVKSMDEIKDFKQAYEKLQKELS